MSKKIPYTQEQIQTLLQNKYTHSVTENRLVFTLEFKQFFVEQVKQGKSTPAIIKEAGYDISLFNRDTIDSLRKRILTEASSEKGLQPPKGLSAEERIAAFEKKNLDKQRTETSIKEMQERIVLLEKQVEFLKKISQLE